MGSANKEVVTKSEDYIQWLKLEIEKLEKHIFERIVNRYDVADSKALALVEKDLAASKKSLESMDSIDKKTAEE